MEAGLREVCRSVRIGKILIQRVEFYALRLLSVIDEAHLGRGDCVTKTVLFKSGWDSFIILYKVILLISVSQFPQDIASRYVLLLDPMLGATCYIYAPFYSMLISHQQPEGLQWRLLRCWWIMAFHKNVSYLSTWFAFYYLVINCG